MADKKLKAIIETQYNGKGVDQAEKDLAGLTRQGEKTTQKLGGMSSMTGKLGGNLLSMAKSIAAPVLGFMAMDRAINATVEFIRGSINDWVDYNEEIRKLGDATGASTEDLSRLMQAADDMGVNMDSMAIAMRLASQNGVKPTIKDIAELSDKLIAIKNDTKRAEEMQKIFGRGWAEVSTFILRGSESIYKMTSAIDDGLVVTKESVEQTSKFRIALDNLNDSVTILKNNMAGDALPAITKAIEDFNEEFSTAYDSISKILDAMNSKVDQNSMGWIRWVKAVWNVLTLQYKLSEGLRTGLYNALDWVGDKVAETGDEIENVVPPVEALQRAYEQSIPAMQYYASQTNKAGKEIGVLGANMEGVEGQMKKYTAQLLFNLAAQDLDAAAALALARELGLVDERTAAIMEALPAATLLFDENADGILSASEAAKGYVSGLGQIDSWLNKLDGRKVSAQVIIDFLQTMRTFSTIGEGARGGGSPGAGHSGGSRNKLSAKGSDTIIPPGYPNDQYTIGVTSGERVTITPPGKTAPGSTITFGNIVINESSNPQATANAVIAAINSRMRQSRISGSKYATG